MSKFKVWIDDNYVSGNCQASDVFANDGQREKGFQSGTGASAIRVNTALRQANLIAVALVNALGISDDYDLTSSLTNIEDWFKSTQLLKLPQLFSVGTENKIKQSLQPETDNSIDLGINTKRFRNIYAHDIYSKDITGETITSTNGFIGDLEGDVKGNVVGDVTGLLFGLADKASRDGAGDLIVDTYMKKSTIGSLSLHRSDDVLVSAKGTSLAVIFVYRQTSDGPTIIEMSTLDIGTTRTYDLSSGSTHITLSASVQGYDVVVSSSNPVYLSSGRAIIL